MNFLMNKKQLQNNIRIAWSTLLLLIVCCFISNDALAQYPGSTSYASTQYRADIDATDSGGGTWGEILKMNVRLEGPNAMFSITSKKGAFYNTNSVTIRSGSHNGPIVATGTIPPGSEAAKLQLDLDTLASFPQSFFATITNNIGYAWVGPIQISKNETAANEPVPWDDSPSGSGPERPIINESPERVATDTAVNIAVTAGQTHSNDMVRVQCTASSSDNTPSNPYRSNWIYSGDTINVPLTFHSAGTQAIFCNTLDNYGETSSLSQRTIIVTPNQRFSISPPVSPSVSPPARSNISAPRSTPTPRRVTSAPAPIVEVAQQGFANTSISIKLTAGHDPQNRDLVKIGCFADDSNKTAEDPYLSDWLPPEGKAKGVLVFYSSGEKNIYCTSYSRQGATSPSTRKTINIRYANQAPSKPEISAYPYDTAPGKTTSIAVTAGADPDGDQVKVECSATDSSITGNTPYVSEWVAPRSTVNAALSFYTSGKKGISCVTIDRKGAQSDKATRNIQVQSPPRYNPSYSPSYNTRSYNNTPSYTPSYNTPNYNNTPSYTPSYNTPNYNNTQSYTPGYTSERPKNKSNTSSSGNCSGRQQQNNIPSFPIKNKERQGEIAYNQPYIPQLPNRSSVFQTPKLHQPDLKGRVFYKSNGRPVHNAMIKFWDVLSGKSYTATTNYNGEFAINFIQKNLTGQIQATKGADTSAIREVRIKADKSALIDLTIMDKPSVQQPQTPWPAKQAAPPRNSIWQFN